MRILSVSLVPPGDDAQWWRISNLAQLLRLQGCEVDVVHYVAKGHKSHERLKSFETKGTRLDSLMATSPLAIPFLQARKASTGDYDIVFGNTYAGTFFSILGKTSGKPLVLDLHGVPEEFLLADNVDTSNMYMFFLMRSMNSMALRFSNKIVCVSRNMVDYLNKKRGVPHNKMVYITNGVHLEFFKTASEKRIKSLKMLLGIEGKFVFGYMGGFQRFQGIDRFIEAAKLVHSTDAVFLVVGGRKESRDKNIVFLPRVARDQTPDYYSICDVMVLPRPSHIATQVAAPTKFAEYAAMGRPVLTTDVGDAANFVSQFKNGVVVQDNHPENLRNGILEFLTMDDSALSRMGRNSRELAEKEFDWMRISEKLVKCLAELVAK